MSRRDTIPIVIPENIGKQCESRVFPVLQARGIECRKDGQSWLASLLQSEDMWVWTAQLRMPNPGEVFDVEVPRYGPPRVHDATVWIDQRATEGSETIRVEAGHVVGSHVCCSPSNEEPNCGPPALADLLMVSTRLVTLTVAPAPDRPILIADAVFANELMPMVLLTQRPARLLDAGQLGIRLHVLQKSRSGFGTPCMTCQARGEVPCGACGGTGNVPCKICDGIGRVRCSKRKCGGAGSYTGNYDEHIVCDRCGGTGQMECYYCHGECTNRCGGCQGRGTVDCDDCLDSTGYNPVTWDFISGALHVVEFSRRNDGRRVQKRAMQDRDPLVLVEWQQANAQSIDVDHRGLLTHLRERASGTASLTEERALRLADHARRLSLFEPLLDHLVEKQKVNEQRPIAFRSKSASAGRRSGGVVYEFELKRPSGTWVKDGTDPFPKGTRILFVPHASSSWREEIPMRWVAGFDPGPTGAKLEAVYSDRRGVKRDVRLLVAFPTGVDRNSIPSKGFLLASQPPPAEETQLKHLRAWCGPNNRLNPVFQSVVFLEVPDSRPAKIRLRNRTIQDTRSQLDAVRWGCSETPLALIKGPPGTGKTTVIVEVIRQLADQGRKVLLCSQAHQAVRNVLERLHGEKRIRMSRHKSGSDDKPSARERQYFSGAIAETFEKSTFDRAEASCDSARQKWETEGAPLRAMEAARDAAVELATARQRLSHQNLDVDVAADERCKQLETSADAEKAAHTNQHDTREEKLRKRLSTLVQEREWAGALAECLRLRLNRLGVESPDVESGVQNGGNKADVDATKTALDRRYTQLFLQRRGHECRKHTVETQVQALETELISLDEAKASRTEDIEERVARALAYVGAREEDAKLAAQEVAAEGRRGVEKRHKRELRDIATRHQKLKKSARAKERKAKAVAEDAQAALSKTTKKKDAVAGRYAAVAGKRPRIREVGDRAWLKTKLPMWWAGEEELLARYSLLRRQEKDLQTRKRESRTDLVAAQGQFDAAVAAEEAEVAAAQDAYQDERNRIDDEEKTTVARVRDHARNMKNGIEAARDRRAAAIVAAWERQRAGKPDQLAALRDELCLESRLLGLVADGICRLEPRIADRDKLLAGVERQTPDDADAIPDSQATPAQREERVAESMRSLSELVARGVYCEECEQAAGKDLHKNDEALTEHLARIDAALGKDIEKEQAKREAQHAAVEATFEATEVRCRKTQSDAIAYATQAMSDDEPSEKWERLAAPIRPAALRLKQESEFLQRWVQDLTANASVVRRLHWDNIDVFLSTCVGVASWHELTAAGRDAVDTVIIDEAAHATLPETLVPMLYGKRCILIGDEKQLPPISMDDDLPPMPLRSWIAESELAANDRGKAEQSSGGPAVVMPSENWLERSFFEWLYLYRSGLPRQMLDKQFRMHPDIAGFISQLFYPEGLQNGVSREDRVLSFGQYTEAVCLIPTDSDRNRFQEKMGDKGGYRNKREAEIVTQILGEAEEHLDLEGYRELLRDEIERRAQEAPEEWPDTTIQNALEKVRKKRPSFGVITPYKKQKEMIRDYIGQKIPLFSKISMNPRADVGSVDSYQGSERDVIIISFVRSPQACRTCSGAGTIRKGGQCKECLGSGCRSEDFSFVNDLRRLNVAFSRARRMLILVGNFRALVSPHHRGNQQGGQVLKEMRQYIRDHGVEIPELEAGYGS